MQNINLAFYVFIELIKISLTCTQTANRPYFKSFQVMFYKLTRGIECFIKFKTRCPAECFRLDKARTASSLNGSS